MEVSSSPIFDHGFEEVLSEDKLKKLIKELKLSEIQAYYYSHI